MKLGLILPMFSGDPGKVLGAAREAEELGFDGVFAFDHLFPPGGPRDHASLEAFSMLAAVAAVTKRVRLGTLVTRASLRPPGLLAKTVSWLDTASEGRFVLGIGTGDPIDRGEHEAYGIREYDKPQRRLHLEETIEALRALFRGETYPGGSLVPALQGPLLPKPAITGGPPIWVGAQAAPVVRMAGRLADGWNGWGLAPEAFAEKVKILRDAAGDREVEPTWAGIVLAGRDRAETDDLVGRRRARGMEDADWAGTAEELAEHLRTLEVAGASWAVMVLAGPADRRRLLGELLVPALSG